MVGDSRQVAENFLSLVGDLPLLAASLDMALQGPLSGAYTVWRSPAGGSVELYCLRRNRY